MGSWTEYTSKIWRELDMEKLGVDEAYLRLHSTLNKTVWLYSLSQECFKCPLTKLHELLPHKHNHLKVNTARGVSFKVFDNDTGTYAFENETALCDITPNLGEFGVYNLTVDANQTCSFTTDKQPVNIYLPMLLVILLVIALFAILETGKYFIRLRSAIIDQETSNETIDENKKVPVKKRLRSLDTFRGMVIVLMIFVNSGGGHYWWIEHAPWNGLHIADIVFPSFLWIMGVCIPISVKSQRNRNVRKREILQTILWRSIKLFMVGLFLNSINGPNLKDLRIMGVLQRFGISYLIVASLYTIFSTNEFILPQSKLKQAIFDIDIIKYTWIFGVMIISVYLGVSFGVEIPGCPRGYLGPGGKHEMGAYKDCIGGVAGYIDTFVLGQHHIFQYPTAKYIYDSKAFDPEGLFGCLLTILQVILGLQCGSTLLVFSEWQSRTKRWLSWSIVLGIMAGILCLFSQETGWIPINKNLWSLSFVFVTAAIDFLLLTIFFFVIDVKAKWNGYPFLQCGMNAILMYIGHTIMHKMLPWHWSIGLMNTHFMRLLECTWNTILWIGIAIYLFKKKIFYSL